MPPKIVTVDVPVKVKDVSVTQIKDVDSKFKDSAQKQIKAQMEKGLAKIKLEVPNGKKLGALAVEIGVTIKRTDQGLYVNLDMAPSEGNFMLGRVQAIGTLPLPKGAPPDDGDMSAAAQATTKKAIGSLISAFNTQAKK